MSSVECPSPSRAELRRNNIKAVARRLFVEHGFHSTGIALIARESGVAVQQLYRDFPSKENIIAAIVEADCKKLTDLASLEQALATKSRDGIMTWLTSATCRQEEESDRLFLEIASEASRNQRISRIFSEVRKTMSENISRAFAGLAGSVSVSAEHRLLAEAFMIVSIGSACTQALHGGNVATASEKLIRCLIDSG
ncbi:TetR/AcrR family transcriptional regulator [Sphingomonas sp. PAMC 26621]|uniref:TetR/AcrR family transcriptional regulator n=1 Tax=Sphingomonas sp. PAMC 26621 TaxID=1112213 RepID=UPI001EE66B50|nr:TetR/AcrR family transcriptional regulator [Sphingomonas sp. PAMC 26621]